MDHYTFFLIMCMVALALTAKAKILDVMDFGAIGDGKTDDTEAFNKAWEAVCGTVAGRVILRLPLKHTFLLKSLRFKGPCKSPSIHVVIRGNIIAPREISDWNTPYMGSWIVFTRVDGLIVDGNGQLDGQGFDWWQCAKERGCPRPYGLKFDYCKNFQLSYLKAINIPSRFLSVSHCENSTISNIDITNPEDSPNTDGMDITHSTNIEVRDCRIRTGDDCIAILSSSSYIDITGIDCGPGHGISIGSLGKGGSYATVEEVHVKNVVFNGSTSGPRIKTWQGGSGYVRKVTYENITIINVDTPIVIDQYYFCREDCPKQTSALNISDISYIDIRGTSSSESAISLNCSQSLGCTNIILDRVHITSADPTKQTFSKCINARGKATDTFPEMKCLS